HCPAPLAVPRGIVVAAPPKQQARGSRPRTAPEPRPPPLVYNSATPVSAQDAMSAPKPAGVLTLVIAMTAGLCGCATVETWRKCGAGCPGDAEISTAVRSRLYQHTELLAPNRVYVS